MMRILFILLLNKKKENLHIKIEKKQKISVNLKPEIQMLILTLVSKNLTQENIQR